MLFPSEYFQDETRDGFLVPEMMKRAWAAELEVLDAVKTICRAHGLSYYATGGTLLGAIRHKGFIPWDDDIDVYMLREDYDRFLEAAKTELPRGLVLAGIYGSEPRLWEANDMPQARVIADETILTLPEHMNRFHAFPYFRVGVDIFPYTYLPRDKAEQYKLFKVYYALNFTEANLKLYRQDGILNQRLKELEKFIDTEFEREDDVTLRHQLRLAADEWIAAAPRSEADSVLNAMYIEVPDDYRDFNGLSGRPLEWHDSTVELPFEITTVSAPVEYEKTVISSFGPDYMTPVMFAGDHEYPFYKNQEAGFRELLDQSGITDSIDDFCRKWHKMIGGT